MSRIVGGQGCLRNCIDWTMERCQPVEVIGLGNVFNSRLVAGVMETRGTLTLQVSADAGESLRPGQRIALSDYISSDIASEMMAIIESASYEVDVDVNGITQMVEWIAEPERIPREPKPQIVESMVHVRPELLLIWQRRPILPANVIYAQTFPQIRPVSPLLLLHVPTHRVGIRPDGMATCPAFYMGDEEAGAFSEDVDALPTEVFGHPLPDSTRESIAYQIRQAADAFRRSRLQAEREIQEVARRHGYDLGDLGNLKGGPAPLPEVEERPTRRILLQEEDD